MIEESIRLILSQDKLMRDVPEICTSNIKQNKCMVNKKNKNTRMQIFKIGNKWNSPNELHFTIKLSIKNTPVCTMLMFMNVWVGSLHLGLTNL